MNHEDVLTALNQACELITRTYHDWAPPQFFFQFSAGFDLDGLFDAPPQCLELEKLPFMPEVHTPDRHHPVLLYGRSGGVPVLASLGHRHLFEGLGPLPCIFPTCVSWKLGIPRCIFVDPVLSLLPDLKTGSWSILTDFVNGHHISPLDGLLPLLDSPFTDMSCALSQHLNSELVNAFSQVSLSPRLCVYEALPGAHFCTPAEAQMARAGHVELVGHDLVMEIITAHALGRQVAALALVAEMAPVNGGKPVRRAEMLETCRFCSQDLLRGLRLAITEIHTAEGPLHQSSLPEATADDILFRDFKRPNGQEPVLKRFLRQ